MRFSANCIYSTLSLLATVRYGAAANWPNGPFDTSARWMTDASGDVVQYVGVNWAGHADAMIPEGLQYQSISNIVSRIKSIGINSIRLTYAIEMIDDIESNGGKDVSIQASLANALGQENGTTIYNDIVKNNPSFSSSTTRLQVFDAVAEECNKQQIYVHLDNHVSKAGWCCTPFDGNSWWGDTYFSVANWTRGLGYMANHGKSWPALTSMSLRNELRQPLDNLTLFQNSYNWQDWYTNIQAGAQAIHNANPNVLVFLSGLDSDTTLQPVAQQTALTPGTAIFNRSVVSPSQPKRLVLELHNYANILGGSDFTNCTQLQSDLSSDGFSAVANTSNPWPLVVTEFGYPINDTTGDDYFVKCLTSYIAQSQAGWQQWALQGSYYIRQGIQDDDEGWGLLNHDWSDWRSQAYVDGTLKNLINATLAAQGRSVSSGGTTGETNSTNSGSGSGSGSGGGGGGASSAGSTTAATSCIGVVLAAAVYSWLL